MNRYLRQILIVLVLSLLSIDADATHLVGGFINYQYKGESSQGVQYTITITSYRDCKPGSIEFPDDIDVCVFNRNNNKLAGTFNFPNVTMVKVNPVGRTDCPEATQVCLEKAIFQSTIVLPKSSFGYFVKWEICCRNTQVNLRNDQTGQPFIGQTYQTIIPPTNVVNSSPYFLDVPVPFICVNDTVQLNNYAVDPDGDKLVYKLATPWYGASISNNFPGCQSTYTPPEAIKGSDYEPGYSGTFPFGLNGYSSINSASGITTFMAKKIGNYAVAIDLEEWRDGVLLSTTRLDLQILVLNCTPNNKPTISTSQKTYTIMAGDKLCFDVTGNDKDNHNITLTGQGDLLSGANGFKGTRATFSPAFSKGTVTSQFCWQTDCNQASSVPYSFSAKAVDDGCPSKFTYVDINILVTPFTGKSTVTGPLKICQGTKGSVYTINTTANTPAELVGHTVDIKVNNGVLVSNTLNSMVVDWDNNATSGSITVTPYSRFGCPGDTFVLNITLEPSPPVPVVVPIDTVCENSNKTYSVQVLAGMTYQWWVSNGSILGSSTNSSISIVWNTQGAAWAKVVQYNANGCPSDTALINVWISKPTTSSIIGRETICPNAKNIQYNSNASDAGSSFFWEVFGGIIVGSNSGNSILVNWGNEGLGYVKVIEINKFGCKGDSVKLPVDKTYDLIAETIQGDTDLCENTINMVYSVPKSPNTTYAWSVTGGVITSGQGSNSITIDWGLAGSGTVSMYETSYDSVNSRVCVSNLVLRNINIRPFPNANNIIGNREVCQYIPAGVYTLNGLSGSKYIWSINNDTSGINGQGTSSITIDYSQEGTFQIRVVEISQYGCEGNPVNATLIVHPKPRTSPIIGDSVICSPNLLNYSYSVSGFVTSTFEWFVNGGIPVNPSTSNSIVVNWTGQQYNSIKTLETSDFGCKGDTIRLDVFYDNPLLYLNYITINPPPQDDNGVDIFWKAINAPRYNNQFIIERRKAGTSDNFVVAGTVDGNIVRFNHFNTNNDLNAWDYRVKGFDLCGKPLYTSIHTNVFLSGNKTDAYSVFMNFTPYLGWGSANIRYDVYRMLKNSGGFELYESNVTDFNVAYDNGLEYYTQCYRISATKVGTDTVSWSNDICFDFEPTLFIPTAFSPNEDRLNDGYSVKGGALKTFEFVIYSRWGEKLFESDDLSFVWDGKYKGVDQPQDVYMYYCRYTGFDGKKYSTKGTITLLR
ncbi:MAG: gliding motility-associated C-terminal domain-containing protein [Bacteroidia bacterium]|nr:gliding motility-associated C-terminal domain-containing protein [Bacteroidia bacterium]